VILSVVLLFKENIALALNSLFIGGVLNDCAIVHPYLVFIKLKSKNLVDTANVDKHCLEASIKDIRTKSRKIKSPLVHTGLPPPPLNLRTHRKFRKIQSFLHQKVRTSASAELPLVRSRRTPPPPDCERRLWTSCSLA